MKYLIVLFVAALCTGVQAQTYNTSKQGGNNNAGSHYVAPVVNKTYTAPTPAPAKTTYTPSPSPGQTVSNTVSPSGSSVNTNPANGQVDYIASGMGDVNGFREAMKDHKWGYVDSKGTVVIPFLYEAVRTMNYGWYGVKLAGQWGFVDRTGTLQVSCQYDKILTGFSGPSTSDNARVVKNGKEIFIRKVQNIVDENTIRDQLYRSASFYEGMGAVSVDGKYGYVDTNYKLVIPLIYDYTFCFSEGLAAVSKYIVGEKNISIRRIGYIDKKGQLIIPIDFEDGKSFREGMAAVSKDGKWSFIDKQGKAIAPFKYSGASDFSGGLACVKRKDKWGYIDMTGAKVLDFKYDIAPVFNSNGLACIKQDTKYGFMDKTGTIVIPAIYDQVLYERFYEGLSCVKVGAKWGAINELGEVKIPIIYDESFAFKDGKATVLLSGKKMKIDKTGSEIAN